MATKITKSSLISSNYNYNYQQEKSQLIEPIRCLVSFKNDLKSNFIGLKMGGINKNSMIFAHKKGNSHLINSKLGLSIGKAQKWWEKGLQPNMKEITSAQDLVDSLLIAGDKLVVVDFFSPGCGGCKALHPKICQLAEMNPDVEFLQVNYEEHKSMCYSLNVHVLPFFRFYRGADGRVCSFSCTNTTIKKFKDALARYGQDRCSLGPAKGLEEKELLALAANKDLSFTYTPKPSIQEPAPVSVHQEVSPSLDTKVPYSPPLSTYSQDMEEKALLAAGS